MNTNNMNTNKNQQLILTFVYALVLQFFSVLYFLFTSCGLGSGLMFASFIAGFIVTGSSIGNLDSTHTVYAGNVRYPGLWQIVLFVVSLFLHVFS